MRSRYLLTSEKRRTNTYIWNRFISACIVSCRVCPATKGKLMARQHQNFCFLSFFSLMLTGEMILGFIEKTQINPYSR